MRRWQWAVEPHQGVDRMAASNTRFTQNSLGQSKTPIDSDHGIYRDLRNVVANYSFETSRRFAGIQPDSGLPDYSRLSCGVGDTQLGAGFCGDLHGRWPSCGVADKARIGRDLFRSEDDPPAAKPATPIAQFALDFPCKESV